MFIDIKRQIELAKRTGKSHYCKLFGEWFRVRFRGGIVCIDMDTITLRNPPQPPEPPKCRLVNPKDSVKPPVSKGGIDWPLKLSTLPNK